MKRTKSTYLALIAVLLSPMAVHAVPILLTETCIDRGDDICAIGIDGLEVGGNTYDVSFVDGIFTDFFADPSDAEFWGDQIGALAASNAIRSVFEGSSSFTCITDTSEGACWNVAMVTFERLATSSLTFDRGYRAWIPGVVGDVGGAEYRGITTGAPHSWVIFEPASTTVSEPGTIALFAVGLLGMGAARRKKKA
jgi:hypothetical protein